MSRRLVRDDRAGTTTTCLTPRGGHEVSIGNEVSGNEVSGNEVSGNEAVTRCLAPRAG